MKPTPVTSFLPQNQVPPYFQMCGLYMPTPWRWWNVYCPQEPISLNQRGALLGQSGRAKDVVVNACFAGDNFRRHLVCFW